MHYRTTEYLFCMNYYFLLRRPNEKKTNNVIFYKQVISKTFAN